MIEDVKGFLACLGAIALLMGWAIGMVYVISTADPCPDGHARDRHGICWRMR